MTEDRVAGQSGNQDEHGFSVGHSATNKVQRHDMLCRDVEPYAGGT